MASRFRWLLPLLGLALWPGWAGAQTPRVLDSFTDQKTPPASTSLRGFSLRNNSSKVIADARVRAVGGMTDVAVTDTPLRPELSKAFALTSHGCLAEVHVRFQDGGTLEAKGLNACDVQTIVVSDHKIALESSVVRGATPPQAPSAGDVGVGEGRPVRR